MHRVGVAAPDAGGGEESVGNKISDDALHRLLGDAHPGGDRAETEIGFAGEHDEDMRVVAQECPFMDREGGHGLGCGSHAIYVHCNMK